MPRISPPVRLAALLRALIGRAVALLGRSLFRPLFGLVTPALITVAVSTLCCPAMADDLTDFEQARALYERRNYAGAAAAFSQMVGSDPPRVSERLLVLESRKYFAASLLFLGKKQEARAQLRQLLAQEPRYTLDPLAFPTEVVTLFETVKASMQSELEAALEAEREEREAQERALAEEARTEQENLRRLLTLAGQAESRRENSRWLATLPFGVGQFQNGHKNLGVAFAVLEGLAATTSVASYLAHQQLADDRPGPAQVGETERLETLWRNTNRASFGVFAVLAVIGIIEAHVRFVPGRVTSRPRQLPPDLERWARERKLSGQGFTLQF